MLTSAELWQLIRNHIILAAQIVEDLPECKRFRATAEQDAVIKAVLEARVLLGTTECQSVKP